MDEPHVSDATLAALLDRRLDANERSRVEAHLAACEDCREALIAASRLLATVPAQRSAGRWKGLAIFAAAAAVLILAISVPRRGFDGIPSAINRERSFEEIGRVDALLPRAGSAIAPSGVEFVWRAQDRASYRVTLTEASGKPLWQATTNDTAIALPDTVRLGRGQMYHWYVDALRLDGSSLTSGARAFTISSP